MAIGLNSSRTQVVHTADVGSEAGNRREERCILVHVIPNEGRNERVVLRVSVGEHEEQRD